MSDFPINIDSFLDPTADEYLGNCSSVGIASLLGNIHDSIEKLEAKVGANASAVTTSHDFKLSGVTGSDKAVSKTGTETLTNKTLTSPKINEDVAVSTTATRLNYLTSDAAIKQYIGNLLMPVGFIYISVVDTNPATVFGFGTWSAFGAGKTLVGFNAAETEFDTVEETGGAKTHTLQTTEIPAHKHTYAISGVGGTGIPLAQGGAVALYKDTTNTGGGGAHNNLQPYITTYFFKRTA